MGKTGPAHEIKLGVIRATIWENETSDHETWFNVTISRCYRIGDEMKDTSSLRKNDLPVAMAALEMAYRWIWRVTVKRGNATNRDASKTVRRK